MGHNRNPGSRRQCILLYVHQLITDIAITIIITNANANDINTNDTLVLLYHLLSVDLVISVYLCIRVLE